MPNFNYTSNARFTPFTFEEMLRPLAMYTEVYNSNQDYIAELGAKADMLKAYANEVPNSKASKLYNQYAKDLEDQAESMAREGLSPSSIQNIRKLRRRYSSEITPIETAVNARKERYAEQRKLAASNPSIMFDRDFSRVTIDELLDNPELGYTPVSGNELYAKGKEAAMAASSRLLETMPALQGQYWKIRQGYGADAANQFLLNQANIPELNEAVNRIISQSGVTENNKSRAIDYAISGIMSGMTYDEKYQANRGYISPAEERRLAMQEEQQKWLREQKEQELRGFELGDGSRIKAIGAGRAIKINPDGTYEPITFPSSSSSKTTTSSIKAENMINARKSFTYLDYGGGDFKHKPDNFFSKSDAEKISFTQLSTSAKKRLKEDLEVYGLTFADVDIYEDHDFASRNHYRVVLKGADLDGKLPGQTNTTTNNSTTSVPSTDDFLN